MESLRGQLLIAHPRLLDPNFERTVVLVVEHGDEGAMGLVLNRRSLVPVAKAAPELAGLVDPLEPVHVGGPVAPDGLIVLAEFEDPSDAALIVSGDFGLVGAEEEHGAMTGVTRRARVFAGHAGWAPGQLDAELEADGWIVERPEPDEILSEEPESLWGAVLDRKGGQYALLARMPPDPSVN
ncbi:MAG: YqgE/AlgH family protein [Actinomycetota bacterium]|nr:YqgE/AlgH family protein [Actinomycetota bacterium]